MPQQIQVFEEEEVTEVTSAHTARSSHETPVEPVDDIKKMLSTICQELKTLRMEVNEMKATSTTTSSNADTIHQIPKTSGVFTNAGYGHDNEKSEMRQLLEAVIRTSEGTQFAQLKSSLSTLAGTEGRTKMKSYFDGFEAVTEGWSIKRRAVLLSTKLVGQARIIFDSLPSNLQDDYFKIRDAICRSNSNISSLRFQAQSELISGIYPKGNETLREFGMRVVALVRDANAVEAPECAIEELATGYFLKGVNDDSIYNALVLLRDSLGFHELIDKAAILEMHKRGSPRNFQIQKSEDSQNLKFGENQKIWNKNNGNAWKPFNQHKNGGKGNALQTQKEELNANKDASMAEILKEIHEMGENVVAEMNVNAGYGQLVSVVSMQEKPENKAKFTSCKKSVMLLTDPTIVIAPNEVQLGKPAIDVDKVIRFDNLAGLVTKLHTVQFAESVQTVILFLPKVGGDYVERLAELLVNLSKIAHVVWNIILPPPLKGTLYDSVIKILMESSYHNIKANQCYKNRNLSSLGWTGDSLNMFHSKNGLWTKDGIRAIRAFLACLNIPIPLEADKHCPLDRRKGRSCSRSPVTSRSSRGSSRKK